MRPGDVYALNDPYHGGTHLPDITVITPVFATADELLFFVASRGHHADIGGITPGLDAAFQRTLDEEGVLIDNFQLVDDGRFLEEELRGGARGGPLPGAQPAPEPRRPAGPGRRQREAAPRSSRAWSASSAWTSCTPTCATCRTTPRSPCAG